VNPSIEACRRWVRAAEAGRVGEFITRPPGFDERTRGNLEPVEPDTGRRHAARGVCRNERHGFGMERNSEMTGTGKNIRMGRLFGEGGKAVVVACDHGMFDGPHAGMEDIPAMLDRLGDGPDAILLSPGMLPRCADYFGRRSAPMAITRLNFNSVFCFQWGYRESVITNLYQPEDAAANGADAVLVCLTLKTGSEAVDARNAEIFADLCLKAHRLGLPVMGEYFPHSHLTKEPEAFHEEILIGCRMLAELGVDCIKTFHTRQFPRITGTCPVPILGLGAEKTPTDLDALALAEKEIRDGAGGVVFGRNAVQASDPRAFVAALQDVVKRGATAADACAKHGLNAES
jgi:DhnA family fructose-bisphosphate aldolase class Ia